MRIKNFLILVLPGTALLFAFASAQEVDSVTPAFDETNVDALEESDPSDTTPVEDPFAVVYVPVTTNSTEPNTTAVTEPWFEDPNAVEAAPPVEDVVEAAPPVDPWFDNPDVAAVGSTTPASDSSEPNVTMADPWFHDADTSQTDPGEADAVEAMELSMEDTDAAVHALEVTPAQLDPAPDTAVANNWLEDTDTVQTDTDPTEQYVIKAEPSVEDTGAAVDGPSSSSSSSHPANNAQAEDNSKTRRCSFFGNLRGLCAKVRN